MLLWVWGFSGEWLSQFSSQTTVCSHLTPAEESKSLQKIAFQRNIQDFSQERLNGEEREEEKNKSKQKANIGRYNFLQLEDYKKAAAALAWPNPVFKQLNQSTATMGKQQTFCFRGRPWFSTCKLHSSDGRRMFIQGLLQAVVLPSIQDMNQSIPTGWGQEL